MIKLITYFSRDILHIIGDYISRLEKHDFFISIASYSEILFLGSFKCKCGPVIIRTLPLERILANIEENQLVNKHQDNENYVDDRKDFFQQLPYDDYEYKCRKNIKPRKHLPQGQKKRITFGKIERREYEETLYINTDLCFLPTFQKELFEDFKVDDDMIVRSVDEYYIEPWDTNQCGDTSDSDDYLDDCNDY